MASGKLLRQLIRSGMQGDIEKFRMASEAVIKEERDKNHHLLARDLENLLHIERKIIKDNIGRQQYLPNLPTNKDNGLLLLEERLVMKEEKDIVLSENTKSSINGIVREHERADILNSYGMEPVNKLLFYGPPGCGKTLAAEVIAHALSMPLVLVRLDSIISSFLGETSANLRKVFDYISSYPVVVVFDEFDALSKDRGDSADHGELKRSVNAVLQMMDSYKGDSIIIATTNYETILDKAIWRRFDEIVRFEMPNLEQIKRLLKLKLSGIPYDFNINHSQITSLFKGMSHADIERILKRAIKEMILSDSNSMQKRHLNVALAREY